MNLRGADFGYDLGCYPVHFAGGDCQAGCGEGVECMYLFLIPPYKNRRSEFIILRLCRACARVAGKAVR